MNEALEQLVGGLDPIEAAIDALLELSKSRGYVTWEEMNELLPDEAIDPSQLETVLLRLEEAKTEVLDQAEASSAQEAAPRVPQAAAVLTPAAARAQERAIQEPETDEEIEEVGDLTIESPGRGIDDPVRMYLTQMGEIPLLTRAEEIRLAKKIELTRMAFRQKVLESDYCARLAVDILQQVHDGTLPFDRTMKISTSEHAAKSRISGRIPVNLATVRALLGRGEEAWQEAQSRRLAAARRRELQQEIRDRRRKTSRLLEELSLRTSRIQPLMRKLKGLHRKMTQLQEWLARHDGARSAVQEEQA
ncbi:MAG: RNA polymerase subunit sigma-70, partial [Planctomycetes bacterium]|nr:RNA polymerase subunit sigma-70 [Planctomycetota bacterium]